MSPSAAIRSVPSLAARYATTSAHSGKHKVVVIGAGAGGLAAANQIYNAFKSRGEALNDGDIAIIDPAQYHDYQPGWTIVGSGLGKKEDYRRSLSSLIPAQFTHINGSAAGVEPQSSRVVLADGTTVAYESLVVAAGLQINFDKISGLEEALTKSSDSKVATIYSYDSADKAWDLIREFDGKGEALFTQPFGPVKCAGAPQKIAYMADSYWKSTSNPLPSRSFITGMPTMFSVPHYSNALNTIRQEKGIDGEFNTNLVSIDSAKKVATFEILAGDNKGKKVEREYGMLHVTPPMGPRGWIKKSAISDAAGWVDVHQGTLQHNKFENIFSLGDSSSLPTSKTAAAITAQTPVLTHNLVSLLSTGKVGDAIYDGYTSCPLFTSRGELMLAEFKYGLERKETFGWLTDQSKPNRAFYHLTKDVFPATYFNFMLKGQWFGPKGIVPPQFVPS